MVELAYHLCVYVCVCVFGGNNTSIDIVFNQKRIKDGIVFEFITSRRRILSIIVSSFFSEILGEILGL